MWAMLQELAPALKVDKKAQQWRTSPALFEGSPDYLVRPGVINMAPAWFEQGHDVSTCYLFVSTHSSSYREQNSHSRFPVLW